MAQIAYSFAIQQAQRLHRIRRAGSRICEDTSYVSRLSARGPRPVSLPESPNNDPMLILEEERPSSGALSPPPGWTPSYRWIQTLMQVSKARMEAVSSRNLFSSVGVKRPLNTDLSSGAALMRHWKSKARLLGMKEGASWVVSGRAAPGSREPTEGHDKDFDTQSLSNLIYATYLLHATQVQTINDHHLSSSERELLQGWLNAWCQLSLPTLGKMSTVELHQVAISMVFFTQGPAMSAEISPTWLHTYHMAVNPKLSTMNVRQLEVNSRLQNIIKRNHI